MLRLFTLSILIVSMTLPILAQEAPQARYWILFSDKPAISEAPVPSERAVWRRTLRGLPEARPLDHPVSSHYLERLRELGIEPHVKSRWLNGISASLTPDLYEQVTDLPFVETVEPVRSYQTAAVEHPDGLTLLEAQPVFSPEADSAFYGLSFTQLKTINAVTPLEQGLNGTGVRLGFLDTHYNFEHEAFARLVSENRLIADSIFATGEPTEAGARNYHGFNVSSIAAGYAEGQLVGPCHGAEIVAATTEEARHEINREEDNLVAGLEWMEQMGVDVVNISLGYNTFDSGQNSYVYEDLDGNTTVTTQAVDAAVERGMTVVVSAGNQACGSPQNCWYYVTAPGDADLSITVGAVTPDSSRSSFSSFGPTSDGRIKPDVSAQGSQVRYALGQNFYSSGGGTSFSAPLVAGAVCQILQVEPSLTPLEVRNLLRETASQAQAPDNALGWGIINVEAAIERLEPLSINQEEEPILTEPTLTPALHAAYPNPALDYVTLSFSVSDAAPVNLRVYDSLGRVVAEPFTGRASARTTVDLVVGDWPPGVYVYRLDSNQKPLIGTFVVAH